eukprot:6122053-Heterocapsa_arctica.AAC.1
MVCCAALVELVRRAPRVIPSVGRDWPGEADSMACVEGAATGFSRRRNDSFHRHPHSPVESWHKLPLCQVITHDVLVGDFRTWGVIIDIAIFLERIPPN